ncbi:hypothetical protein HU200_041306 [Digitaria exilis]|uniref:Small ribosomal subunit protein mS38 n=1 Tax=Digitaria exilis TaxID=1010633 RepID=A0A835B8D6_9POAL|nr:hypothetical protein HU200_041306 [Digitaria exilis]
MAAAAAPLRRLLLRLREPPPLHFNTLLSRLPPQLQEIPTPTPAPPPLPASAPARTPPASLRDALLSFHPGLQIHPCLDPIGDAPAIEEGGGGEAAEVWADSVKKKRKRKMNKHKLRKLRKRLRRQT